MRAIAQTAVISPAGFGGCGRCAFAPAGDATVCAACAQSVLRECADPARGLIGNRLADVWAAGIHGPVLANALHRYKEGGHRGWARVFARLLLARLEQLGPRARAYDLIVASPTFVGPGGRAFGHVELVLEWLAREAPGRWPVQPGAIVRSRPAAPLKRCRGLRTRLTVARTELRAALSVPRPQLVCGRAVLIFDDVLTTGVTCDEVARALIGAGASRTGAIVLARQPLRRETPLLPQP